MTDKIRTYQGSVSIITGGASQKAGSVRAQVLES